MISVRQKSGDSLVGERGPLSGDLYAAGMPPMHGFAAKRPIAPRVAHVRIGDELRVQREGDEWVALDDEGVVGTLRWLPSDEGKPVVHGATDEPVIRLPARGVLRVRRLVLGPDGAVKDVGGEVRPTP